MSAGSVARLKGVTGLHTYMLKIMAYMSDSECDESRGSYESDENEILMNSLQREFDHSYNVIHRASGTNLLFWCFPRQNRTGLLKLLRSRRRSHYIGRRKCAATSD